MHAMKYVSRLLIPGAILLSILINLYHLFSYGLLFENNPLFPYPVDHHKYIYMATTGILHVAPFGWRVAVPFLASLLPTALPIAFLVLSLIGAIGTGVVLYELIRAFGFSGFMPWLGILLYLALPKLYYLVFDFWLPDGLSYLVITLSILLIVRKQDIAFALLVAIGALVKESCLFVLPLFYSLNAVKIIDWKCAKKTIAVSLPAIFVTVFIRILIPSWNSNPLYTTSLPANIAFGWSITDGAYDYLQIARELVIWRINNFNVQFWDYTLLPSIGITVILPFFYLRKNAILALRFSPYILAVFSQVIFARDSSRLLMLVFPAAIILSINSLTKLYLVPHIAHVHGLNTPACSGVGLSPTLAFHEDSTKIPSAAKDGKLIT